MVATNPVKFVAVFDAEYTANTNEYKGIQEMIQCALQIVPLEENGLGSPVEKYEAFTKTTYNKSLSDFIVKLTGIDTKNVESGKDLKTVIDELIDCLTKYNVEDVYIWGPDYKILSYNLELIEYPKERSFQLLNRFIDISETLSAQLGSNKTLSQIQACKISGLKPVGRNHNATDDVKNLVALINKNQKIIFLERGK